MIKRSFIGLLKPRIEYEAISSSSSGSEKIARPPKVTLFADKALVRKDTLALEVGTSVKTGQKLGIFTDSDEYVISTVTGTVSSISAWTGDFGQQYTAVVIKATGADEMDDEFGSSCKEPSINNLAGFLKAIPGKPDLGVFTNSDKSVKTIVISGTDSDIQVTTSQQVVRSDTAAIKKGVGILKQVTGVSDIIMAVPEILMGDVGAMGVNARAIDSVYPSALPKLVVKELFNKEIPANQTCEENGILFLTAEAVASIGNAYNNGQIPVEKKITVINKSGTVKLVSARIGTPIGAIFKTLGITLNSQDRIILGGPMRGSAAYSEDNPVQSDTDAIIIQDRDDVPDVSDTYCINCGECIRMCPANVPVNVLIRFLEAGEYQEAADNYDLHSCIECGLCSYVCTSKIPVFQYIRLAKFELARTIAEEADDA